ncbi:MAG: hypothetical protein OEZ43_02055 [Gammaproteobacteria bacterium]|nr:hypothetical protein [Gammaproteobacteria bacterium]
MLNKLKSRLLDFLVATIVTCVAAIIIYVGDQVTGIELELFKGIIGTFTPLWIIDLILVPFIAGVVLSMLYGLGGKMIAYFPPLLVRIPEYIYAEANQLGADVSVLPIGYWILILIVAVEACGVGGIVGEVIVKRTYGRSHISKTHKRHESSPENNNKSEV